MALTLSPAGLRCATMAWCCLMAIIPTHLYAETPTQALQATLDRFQSILHDAGLGEDRRQEQVVGIILDRFDFREMSKRILGPYWNQAVNHQDAFVAEFAAFMERIFLKHFDQIKGLKVSCRDEETQGSLAKVVTNLSTAGEEFPIIFRMHHQDSGWKIYDATLGNGTFSLVSNYRTQLRWILQSSSFEQLIQIISEKR